MPRRLIYSPQSLLDLSAARSWLGQAGSGRDARSRLVTIRDGLRELKRHPCRWPAVDHPGIRERPCAGGWRALYRVVPDTGRDETAGDVWVLRLYGPGQDRGEPGAL